MNISSRKLKKVNANKYCAIYFLSVGDRPICIIFIETAFVAKEERQVFRCVLASL